MSKENMIVGVAKWIVDYLEIPNYLHVKSKSILEGEKTYESEEEYWHDLLGPSFHKTTLRNPKIREDDCIVLKNFQLSQWFPKNPGLYWTNDGTRLRRITEGRSRFSPVLGFHYDPNDKGRMIHGGFGTVRTQELDNSRLYGATTSGKLNAAIPILISKRVSKNLLKFSKQYPLIEVDLKGVIKPVPFTYRHNFSTTPRLVIVVNSILNIKKYISDFELSASAWTIYYNRAGENEKKYGYTYCSFNPIEESNIIDATHWINNYIDEYTKGSGIPICEFDEVNPRFQSAVVPLKDVMTGNVNFEALNSLFSAIDFRRRGTLFESP